MPLSNTTTGSLIVIRLYSDTLLLISILTTRIQHLIRQLRDHLYISLVMKYYIQRSYHRLSDTDCYLCLLNANTCTLNINHSSRSPVSIPTGGNSCIHTCSGKRNEEVFIVLVLTLSQYFENGAVTGHQWRLKVTAMCQ